MVRENERLMSDLKKGRKDTLDTECIVIESDQTDCSDGTTANQGRKDTPDVECIVIESDQTDCSDGTSANQGKRTRKHEKFKSKNGEVFDEEKKPKRHKREVDSPPEECHENVKVARHECSINAIYHKQKPTSLLKALKKSSYDGSDPEIKISSNELDPSNSDFTDTVVESMKLDPILKLPLPPTNFGSLTYTPECTKCRNDVNNPTIRAADRRIEQIVDSVLVSEDRYKKDLNYILDELNDAIKFEGFINLWTWFGSYLNGLVCLDSDINLHFECYPETDDSDFNKLENMLEKVAAFIKARGKEFHKLKLNPSVRFPCVKTSSKRLKKDIQITFSTELNSGDMLIARSLLTKLYLDMSPNLKYLTVMVRIILQRYRIHGTVAKFRTYTIFWLVVFFMQQAKLLPPVIDVRNSAIKKNCVNGWDCSLPESYSYPTEPVSLYSLLHEFFKYYKTVNFSSFIICPFLGCKIRVNLYEQYSLFMPQIHNPLQLTFLRNVISLQDPCDFCQNVAEYIEPENANKFNIVCHRFCERFANSIEKMETMDCFCEMLTNEKDFFQHSPYNLTQFDVLVLHTIRYLNFDESREKKLDQMHFIEAIRVIMEAGFQFKRSVFHTSQNITKTVNEESNEAVIVNETVPVVYLVYESLAKTWVNKYIKEIIPQTEDEKKKIRIHITCELFLKKHFVKIFVQGEAHFVKFLNRHLLKLLKFILERIVL